MNLTVDVISDVTCPWCYLGKKRLEKAIAAFDDKWKVRVHWLPYQLNPTMPEEGISRKEYRIRKFGSWERSLALDAKVVEVGETEGVRFAFDRIERTPNTVGAHRLISLADQQRCQDAVVEALFRAYFTEGRDISNRQTLIDVVAEAGLERQLAVSMLNSDEGMDAFRQAEELSRRHQVDGVPFFILNNEITLSGAQQPDAFLNAFKEAIGSQLQEHHRDDCTILSVNTTNGNN
jgi:predicted DsbA family dithiol-disulfide isomerase